MRYLLSLIGRLTGLNRKSKKGVNMGVNSGYFTSVILKIRQHMLSDAFKKHLQYYDFSYLDMPAGTEGAYVLETLSKFKFEWVKIQKFYVSWWKPSTWKNVNTAAYVNVMKDRPKEHYVIYVNASVPFRNHLKIIAHEICHLAGFSHGANWNSGNKGTLYFESVPVVVEEYFKMLHA